MTAVSLPRKVRWAVYLSHSLSTWGDRMWGFGVGLFLVIISPQDLRVTAIYGLSMGVSVLLFGALVGDWVDTTPRLKAARTSLLIQNISVIMCAGVIFTVITMKSRIEATWEGGSLLYVCYAGIILVAIVSTLASMATSIAVQKDWIVVICGRDKQLLASMTATLRRIDLVNKLVAPIATGQIMFYTSSAIGALFIAGWNLVSMFVEFLLLKKVYNLCPALALEKSDEEVGEEMINLAIPAPEMKETTETQDTNNDTDAEVNPLEGTKEELVSEPIESQTSKQKQGPKITKSGGCLRMFSGVLVLYRGWRVFMGYKVAFAGLGLACLYMTVLGFDNITVGYSYTQGINESIMGVMMAAGAITGILGTVLYPVFHRKIGLQRTGLFSFLFEVSFLCLCVASVWAPGSPFDPFYDLSSQRQENIRETCITGAKDKVLFENSTALESQNSTFTYIPSFGNDSQLMTNLSLPIANVTTNLTVDATGLSCHGGPHSYISVILLLTGIIGARCGLWMADLTITQLFLESVKETERGVVNGVQTSLNKLMDMVKFMLVIAFPQRELFGYLILVSFVFICIGWAFYARYSYTERGHIFPFHNVKACHCSDRQNNNLGSRPTAADGDQAA